jgi:hypothetical protein
MLTLSKRDAKIGRNIPFRTQDHGDEQVRAADIRVTGLHLEPAEFNALLQEPRAHSAFFVTRAGTRLMDPLIRSFAPFQLLGKIEQADVVLYLGLGNVEVKLGTCKLKSVCLELKAGGMTELSCTVQTTPTLDKRIAQLIDHMGSSVQIEITYEHNAEQPDLALGDERPKDDDDDDDDEEGDTPSRGRRGRARNGRGVHAR